MSTLKVDQIQGSTGTTVTIPSGTTIVNSGTATNFGLASTHEAITKAYGYAQQRTSTVELKDSFNISSWVDDTTGRSTWNINADMGNTTYTITSGNSYDGTSGSGQAGQNEAWVVDAGSLKVDTHFGGSGSFAYYDCDYVYAAVHGDLA